MIFKKVLYLPHYASHLVLDFRTVLYLNKFAHATHVHDSKKLSDIIINCSCFLLNLDPLKMMCLVDGHC